MPATQKRPKPAPAHASAKAGKPHKVLHLSTYDRLEAYLGAFAGGHFNLLILVGAGGLAKSRSVRAASTAAACWIEGNATPFGMYAKLYRHRDEFVVIDDVDALYADRSGVRLLKCLCQTEEEKAVAWHSDARSLERQGIPREFTTKSRVVIICQRLEDAQPERGGAPGPRACADVRARRRRGAPQGREHGSTTRRFMSGLPLTCTGCASRRCGITCGPGSSRPPAWTGPRSWRPRPRTSGRGSPPSCWPARPRQHRRAGQGVRRAGRRVPGDVLQLPALSSEVDNGGYVAELVMLGRIQQRYVKFRGLKHSTNRLVRFRSGERDDRIP